MSPRPPRPPRPPTPTLECRVTPKLKWKKVKYIFHHFYFEAYKLIYTFCNKHSFFNFKHFLHFGWENRIIFWKPQQLRQYCKIYQKLFFAKFWETFLKVWSLAVAPNLMIYFIISLRFLHCITIRDVFCCCYFAEHQMIYKKRSLKDKGQSHPHSGSDIFH